MSRFIVATYNVHKCRGMDRRTSPKRIAKVMRELNADVIAAQEIYDYQAIFLAAELGLQHVFAPARQIAGQSYGNAIFSRFPIPASASYDITVAGREPRNCLRADVEVAAMRRLHVFDIHLGTSFFERRSQAARIVGPEVLGDPICTEPRLLLGDFNEWTRGLATRTLGRHMVSADLGRHLRWKRSYPGVLPLLHLDHVYYDDPLELERLWLHRSLTSITASDHLPLVAEMAWRL